MRKAKCLRCGKPFIPKRTGLKTLPISRCCPICQVRNLLDALDVMTPPWLLDHQTKNPQLLPTDPGPGRSHVPASGQKPKAGSKRLRRSGS